MAKGVDLNLLIDFSETLTKELKTAVTDIHDGKTRPSDFKILKKLAKGGYGEVYVVERNSKVYAMKKVPKQLVLKNSNTTFFMNEKEIMTSHGADWLVRSHMCLQDETHLFYIMEFVHGGDLLGYLSRKDILREEEIRFYAAELFMAIDSMHKIGWIHRDLKPDNILLDRNGHVKLGDFGSCIKMKNGRVVSSSTVGTPDYISPDVLSSTGETIEYGPEVDYWTAGVIIYEMFYGTTPFYSNSLRETYSRIQNIDFTFEDGISEELRSLIKCLICDKEQRIGFEQIKTHPFFKGVDWENMRSVEPPFRPQISNEEDISNFIDTDFSPDTTAVDSGFLNFIGFTYDPEHVSTIVKSIVALSGNPAEADASSKEAEDLGRLAQCRMNELNDLKAAIAELTLGKTELSTQVASLNKSLLGTHDQILHKKTMLEQLQAEISIAREHLEQIKADIVEKLAFSEAEHRNRDTTNISEELKDIKKAISRAKLIEKLNEVKEAAYWLYKQNQNLSREVEIGAQRESDNKSFEEMKRQVRIQKSELREYEQKIENEIVQKRKLEGEIKELRRALKEASRSFNNFVLHTTHGMSNKELEISIENGMMKVDGKERPLSAVFVRELMNNELHHLPEKRRALSLQMVLLSKPLETSSSSGTRRTLKVLEADLKKEEMILKGLRDLLTVLQGRSREEAELQMRGSQRKISELHVEIEKAKKSTIVDDRPDETEKVYEFNGHVFHEMTVGKGTLCDHCNRVLYGVVNQAYCCKECLLVLHKTCYVLVDVSCELNKAIKNGQSLPIVCRTIEDKEKLLRLNKVM